MKPTRYSRLQSFTREGFYSGSAAIMSGACMHNKAPALTASNVLFIDQCLIDVLLRRWLGRIDSRFVPVFLDVAVFHANHVVMIPRVHLRGIVRVFRHAVP